MIITSTVFDSSLGSHFEAKVPYRPIFYRVRYAQDSIRDSQEIWRVVCRFRNASIPFFLTQLKYLTRICENSAAP